MAVTGLSRVLNNRRFEDYRSLKQSKQYKPIKEFIISGTGSTADAEFEFTSDVINYIAAEGQIYIRTEAHDATQINNYVYIEYQDSTGAIKTILTADLHATATETEMIVTGADDFFRLRQMICELASVADKAVLLTDAEMGGVDDVFGFIEDENSQFAAQRYFVQPAETCACYLGRVIAKAAVIAEAAAGKQGIILSVTYTPKVVDIGEPQVKADITTILEFNEFLDWQPCIELEPATEVIFSWNHNTTAHVVWFEAMFLEDYGIN